MARTIALDHGDKRAVILREAAKLFAEEGYGRASMAEIAKACNISKANIYHYYSSKEAILFDMLESHLKYLLDRIGGMSFPRDDPEDRLIHLMTEILLAYQGADAEHDVLLSATQALPEEQQEKLRQYQRDYMTMCRTYLEKLVSPHVLADNSKMRAVTMSVFGMLNWHYKWSHDADEAGRREHARLIAQLAIGGLKNVT